MLRPILLHMSASDKWKSRISRWRMTRGTVARFIAGNKGRWLSVMEMNGLCADNAKMRVLIEGQPQRRFHARLQDALMLKTKRKSCFLAVAVLGRQLFRFRSQHATDAATNNNCRSALRATSQKLCS